MGASSWEVCVLVCLVSHVDDDLRFFSQTRCSISSWYFQHPVHAQSFLWTIFVDRSTSETVKEKKKETPMIWKVPKFYPQIQHRHHALQREHVMVNVCLLSFQTGFVRGIRGVHNLVKMNLLIPVSSKLPEFHSRIYCSKHSHYLQEAGSTGFCKKLEVHRLQVFEQYSDFLAAVLAVEWCCSVSEKDWWHCLCRFYSISTWTTFQADFSL